MNMENSKLDSPKFTIGEVVKHRFYPFRGVIFDVDPEFMNSEEWYDSIPAHIRPKGINHFIIYLLKMKMALT